MKSDQVFETIKKWFYKITPANPSGQDQLSDHTFPHGFVTFMLIGIPVVGVYLGLIPVLFALYKEFIEDEHYKDFFSKTDSGADGRCDLFFRLLGSLVAYATLIWR